MVKKKPSIEKSLTHFEIRDHHIIISSYNRISVFTEYIDILRDAFRNTMKNYKFKIISICILPDHIHLLLKPINIEEYPKIISSVKYYF